MALFVRGISKVDKSILDFRRISARIRMDFFSIFKALAGQQNILAVVDFINVWGLIIIGTFLIAGVLARQIALAGMTLLILYYLAHPPLIGLESVLPQEGSYLVVNKNLIEVAALLVLALFPTSHIIGLDRLLFKNKPSGEIE